MLNKQVAIEWIRVEKLSELTGETVQAIRAKIKKGKLQKGYHWVKREGRIFINTVRYNEWISGKLPSNTRV